MSKREKAEFLILKNNKYFIWICTGVLVLIGYNIFSVAVDMQFEVEGGYYSYTTMTLAYLLGVILPMAAGSFLGGFDSSVGMLEYKLVNQTPTQWGKAKIFLLGKLIVISTLILNVVGIALDVYKETMCGGFQDNVSFMIKRFVVVWTVWQFWGVVCFAISLLTRSPGFGVFMGIVIFFGEQYIEQYIRIPFGIMWNLKSFEYYFFNNESVPFGVVQSSYNDVRFSIAYILLLMLGFVAIPFIYLKAKYQKK